MKLMTIKCRGIKMILSVSNFTSTIYEETDIQLDNLLESFNEDIQDQKVVYEIILKAALDMKKEKNDDDIDIDDDISDDELDKLLASEDEDNEFDEDDEDVRQYVDDEDLKDEYFTLKKELNHGRKK